MTKDKIKIKPEECFIAKRSYAAGEEPGTLVFEGKEIEGAYYDNREKFRDWNKNTYVRGEWKKVKKM